MSGQKAVGRRQWAEGSGPARPLVGNWVQTRGRHAFSLTEPRPEDVCIEDIAHSLAHQCRFTGHTRVSYSVAEHCVRCSEIVDSPFELDALLHDAAEAYLGDISSPLKREIGETFGRLQGAVERVIAHKFCVLYPFPIAVKRADEIMLATECRDLLGTPINEWVRLDLALPICVSDPWSADYARHRFLSRFDELGGDRT